MIKKIKLVMMSLGWLMIFILLCIYISRPWVLDY